MSSSPLPMLSIPEKETTSADLYGSLRRHVSTHYSESDANRLDGDLRLIHSLRSPGRDSLIRYCRALFSAIARIPHLPLTFTWRDAFRRSRSATCPGLHFDLAASLFNLASSYSTEGIAADRSTEDGRRKACNAFQNAAGVLGIARERAVPEVGAAVTVDLGVECLFMLENLMLAQAQECFFEKVVTDGKGAALCSKVAFQVFVYYKEVKSAFDKPPLNNHMDKAWMCHVQLKRALFYAEACYRAGLDLHDKEELGEEIARLKLGIDEICQVKRSVRGAPAPLLSAISLLENLMNSNLAKAVKENDDVYLFRVPDPKTLALLPGVSLVKPMVMDELLDPCKEILFSNLIPESMRKTLSRYSEMVDDIIRVQAEKLQQESEVLKAKLKKMGLPDYILALDGGFSFPLDLKKDVETVDAVGGLSALEADLQLLGDLRAESQGLLREVKGMLEKEERDDDLFRKQFGTRWTRPPSKKLTETYYEKLNKFADNIKQAAEGDAYILQSVEENFQLLAILNYRPIESAVPILQRPEKSTDGKANAIVSTLKQNLRQLEALGNQSTHLEDMLKEIKRKDDISPKLMAISGPQEDLLKKEISKYNSVCEDIVQNIQAQEKLLHEIQAQNDEFSVVFNLNNHKVVLQERYNQIAAAVAKFREIKANINEGLKFYASIQEAITNVKQQCSDFTMARNIDCQETIREVQSRVASMDLSSDARTGYIFSDPSPPELHEPTNAQFRHPHPQAPPSQYPNTQDGQRYQGYYQPRQPQGPESSNMLPHETYPQMPPNFQQQPEQRYPSTSYRYASVSRPPFYEAWTGNSYQPPQSKPPCKPEDFYE